MLVYVISKSGKPLMPTERCGKIRCLLKAGKAKVVRRIPFTIRLCYDTPEIVQEVSLGVDAGSHHIGLSATTKQKVLYEADVQLRNDIVKLLASRRELRMGRRYRKTRYRKPRFENRRGMKDGLAPSIRHKIDCHMKVIGDVCGMLPVSKIVVETASFDIQKIKNPDIHNEQYQQGDQLGFWNVREYVLFRDNHECQCCRGKSKDKILNVHHIESRKTGGDAPNNLITLCETCHKGYHCGDVELPKRIRRGMKFNHEAFMGIMRRMLYNRLKECYSNVHGTFGYITKHTRIATGLPKEHFVDARCISGNPSAVSDGNVYFLKKIRCHNRQIHKANVLKGGIRKRNQAGHLVNGFALFDKVLYDGKPCFVYGRRSTGYFSIRLFDGTSVHTSVNSSVLKFLTHSCGYIQERKCVFIPQPVEVGVSNAG